MADRKKRATAPTAPTAPREAATTPTLTTKPLSEKRRSALEGYYSASYGRLTALVYETSPELYFNDAESILKLLAEALPTFNGRPTAARFEDWASDFVVRQARRFADTGRILAATRPYIRTAIRRTMPYDIFDSAASMFDYEQDIAIRVFATADDLSRTTATDTAKLTTRVYALAKKHIEFYPSSQLRRRFNATLRRIAMCENPETPFGDTETLPEYEIQQIKFDELDAA